MKKIFLAFGIIFAGFSAVNALPQINFSVSPSVGLQNTEFTIDARDSRNSSGNTGGIDFRCQYFYGQEWTQWSTRLILKFKTEEIGRHRTKCQIRDRETGAIQNTYRDFQVKKDFLRRVRIEVDKLNITVGEAVFFNLIVPTLAGENPDTILARWDFNSDGVWDTDFSRKKVISYSYSRQGQVSPTVEVKFPNGRVIKTRGLAPKRENGVRDYDFTEQRILVSSQTLFAPVVNVSPGTNGFTEKTIFKFDASKSRVPRLGWMEWSIDGQEWVRFPRKKEASLNFNSAGKHEVRTRVCTGKKVLKCAQTTTTVDVKNDPLDFSVKIALQNKTNPIISRIFTNGNVNHYVPVEVGDNIIFSAIAIRYGNLGKLLYRWDFNSDGDWDTDFSKNNFTETHFDHLGEFEVKVQIQSEDGIMVTESKKILVKINPKPTVYVAQKPAKIFVGERAFFTPKFSSDIGAQNRFDMDNDGLWESNFRGISSQYWTFQESGEKVIKMQIRDKGGNVTTINKTVQVYDLPTPKARVAVSKKFAKVGEPIVFDASDSAGRSLRYFWDFESTGEMQPGDWEEIRRGPVKISRVFRELGEHIISLKVVDETGHGDQIFFTIIVQDTVKNKEVSSSKSQISKNTQQSYFRTNQKTPGWFAFL